MDLEGRNIQDSNCMPWECDSPCSWWLGVGRFCVDLTSQHVAENRYLLSMLELRAQNTWLGKSQADCGFGFAALLRYHEARRRTTSDATLTS